jgi:hypothetical protein
LKLDQQQDIIDDLDTLSGYSRCVGGMADYAEIIEVRKEADDHGSNFGGTWHSDVTHRGVLALIAIAATGSALYVWQQLKSNEAFLNAALKTAIQPSMIRWSTP